jgi:hypothetical protein
MAAPAPAAAAAMRTYRLKSGVASFELPATWTAAYDRSDAQTAGTLAFFGNFRTFDTVSVAVLTAAEEPRLAALLGGGPAAADASALAEALISEPRDAAGTFDFRLLAAGGRGGAPPAAAAAGGADAAAAAGSGRAAEAAAVVVDVEYVVTSCRGEVSEGSGGRRRCQAPDGSDLPTVTRHALQTAVVLPGGGGGPALLLARGSALEEHWPSVAAELTASVRSVRPGGR